MAQTSPILIELARRIVAQEVGGSTNPAASAIAIDMVCRRLRDELADLLGFGGVSALLKRALHLAQRDESLLAGVAVSEQAPACFAGLAESLAAGSDEESARAAARILAHVLDLLVMLLGEELGLKPVRKLWPQADTATEMDE